MKVDIDLGLTAHANVRKSVAMQCYNICMVAMQYCNIYVWLLCNACSVIS